jgi:hypothetical protein
MRPPMDLSDPGSTEIVVALGGPLALAAYVGLIVMPAWTSYGRWWERIAATFLTFYIFAALVGIGAAIGLGIIWTYDEWAA